eukprot:scaffold1747_cov251-Pinguiococcus_pyrenoidosus.AAC.6
MASTFPRPPRARMARMYATSGILCTDDRRSRKMLTACRPCPSRTACFIARTKLLSSTSPAVAFCRRRPRLSAASGRMLTPSGTLRSTSSLGRAINASQRGVRSSSNMTASNVRPPTQHKRSIRKGIHCLRVLRAPLCAAFCASGRPSPCSMPSGGWTEWTSVFTVRSRPSVGPTSEYLAGGVNTSLSRQGIKIARFSPRSAPAALSTTPKARGQRGSGLRRLWRWTAAAFSGRC